MDIPTEPIEQRLIEHSPYSRRDSIGRLLIQATEAVQAFQSEDLAEAAQAYASFIINWCHHHPAPMKEPGYVNIALAAMVQAAAMDAGLPRPRADALVYAMIVDRNMTTEDGMYIGGCLRRIGWFYACALTD